MKNKWIKKDKSSGLVTLLVPEPEDSLQVVFYVRAET